MVTRQGTVKRMPMSEIYTARKAGIRVLSLEEGDELIGAFKTTGNDNLILATRQGMAICFNEQDIRCMGRMAVGVRGIKLKDNDCVVGADVAQEGKTLLTVTEQGFGKRTPVEEYLRGEEVQSRGGKGMKNYRLTDKTGLVAGAVVVDEEDDVLLIESGGVILRTAAKDISTYGRVTQGVIIMRIAEENRVIAVSTTMKTEEE